MRTYTSLQAESIAFQEAFEATDLRYPFGTKDVPELLIKGVAHPFLPDEPSPEALRGELPDRMLDDFEERLQVPLREGLRRNSRSLLRLGHGLGRLMAAHIHHGKLSIDPVLHISEDKLSVDEKSHDLTIAPDGTVVELGMGLGGMLSHVQNVKSRRYRLIGVTNKRAEAETLDGVASYFGLREDLLINEHAGIAPQLTDMLDSGYRGEVDVVVASRVHMAGTALLDGVRLAADLLRPGGLLVSRGPVKVSAGDTSYNQVTEAIRNEPGMRIIRDNFIPIGKELAGTAMYRVTVAVRKEANKA